MDQNDTNMTTWKHEIGDRPVSFSARQTIIRGVRGITVLLSYPKESVRSRVIEDTDAPFESLMDEVVSRLQNVPHYLTTQLSPEMRPYSEPPTLVPSDLYDIPYFVHEVGAPSQRVRAQVHCIPDSWSVEVAVSFMRDGAFADEELENLFSSILDMAGHSPAEHDIESFKVGLNENGLFEKTFSH